MIGCPSGRPLLAAVAAVSLVTTGCLGVGPSPPATPTATPTASVGTDCPPALTVYALDEDPANLDSVVDYENLSAEKRATFDRARNERVTDFAYDWRDIDVVAYDGAYYRTGVVVC
ncbi:hypothetical protein ACOZ4L_03445 [Haloplanus ruber]|uniref:DUF7979 domain-containing protein n=1 Tax=Haloplanus ruber TaxID=869892 RepID=A0ABD6D032_9EURY|nr:hypothetical protein [Haloplanus ruber]